MKNYLKSLTFMGALLFTSSLFAASEITVRVNGMVCAFCAQGLKKSFAKEEAVDSFDVSLEKKVVSLKLKEQKTMSDDRIKQIIKDAGFAVEGIERK